ncbi:MAG: membrane protein insertion efficiency factor YidD [Planctomycetota bacterium]
MTHPPAAPPQPWLNTVSADLASLAVWSAGAALLAALTPLPGPKLMLPLLAAGAGLWGAGVERGWARRPGWPETALLAAAAAALHVLASLPFGALLADAPLPLPARATIIFLVGLWIPRGVSRLDRQEEGWRHALRCGAPTGSVEAAHAIGHWRPPTPVRWLLLPLRPLDWALRAGALLAILGYQLTFSRLMPSACRYEPSCSRYGWLAYLRHDFIRASILTSLRILRCSPLGSGGYDPIP